MGTQSALAGGGRFGVQLDEGAVTRCSGSGKQLQQEWGQIPTAIRDRTQPNPQRCRSKAAMA